MRKSYKKSAPMSKGIRGGVFLLFFGCFLLTAPFLGSVAGESSSNKKPIEKSFPNSEKCKRCHLRAFEEWEASAQSRSIVTSPFRVTLDQFLASSDKKDHAMCFRCHAPHILEYADHLPRFIKEVQSKDPQMDGVGCPQCHLIQDVDMNSHPPTPTFKLGTTIFGGYDKAAENLAHQSQKLDLYRESKFCVTCHDSLPKITDSAKDLPGWLGPWEKTKAETNGKPCQSCHMPEAVDESANGERVRKVANHSFPGRFGKVRAEAVTLDFTTDTNPDTSQVQVSIQSLVPHNLPLPHPGWSRVVVDLSIFGKNLKKVYNEQRYYERTFGDAEGKETVFDFEAKKVLRDTLLKPEEMRVEDFTFPTPQDAPSMDVVVTITYAPVHGPQDFLKKVEQEAALGQKDKAFQSVQIAQKKSNVPLKK